MLWAQLIPAYRQFTAGQSSTLELWKIGKWMLGVVPLPGFML